MENAMSEEKLKQKMGRWKKEWKLFPIKEPVRRENYQEVGYAFLLKDWQIEFVEIYFDGDRVSVKPLAWFELKDADKIIKAGSSLKRYIENSKF